MPLTDIQIRKAEPCDKRYRLTGGDCLSLLVLPTGVKLVSLRPMPLSTSRGALAVVKDGVMHVQAGCGVVADSDPEAEYEETRQKARAAAGGGGSSTVSGGAGRAA